MQKLKHKTNERFSDCNDRRILIVEDRGFLKGIRGGETYTLDQIKECAMKAISKMTDDLNKKEEQG